MQFLLFPAISKVTWWEGEWCDARKEGTEFDIDT